MVNRKAVIVCAPAGTGKSRNAEALRAMFGCTCIVDEWDGESEVPLGALVLTNAMPHRFVTGDEPPLREACNG